MPMHKICPKCGTQAPLEAAQCNQCGRVYRTTAPLPEPPTQMIERPYQQPPAVYQQPPPPQYLPPEPPAPNYQQQPLYQIVPEHAKKMDVCALVAAISGILGFWAYGAFFFGPLGLILGVVSLHRIKHDPYLKGHNQAMLGIILGGISTMYAAVVITYL